jgi:undecaprenyl-diphosphatase
VTLSDWIHTLILALIQGLTEFLPISSSAHLILPSQLFGWSDQGLAFDVGVHVGTLTAVIIYFRREVVSIVAASTLTLTGKSSDDGRLGWLVALATIPAVIAGLLLGDWIDTYGRSILVIAGTTILFGLALGWADATNRATRMMRELGLKDALVIGVAQAIALIPGTSRSGITITAALMLGFDRQSAARFSFLLSIPVILGAGLLKGKELVEIGAEAHWQMIGVGALVAALSAWACIHLFLKLLDQIGMRPFVIYRLILGVTLIAVWALTRS